MQPLIDLGDRLVTATAALVANPTGIGYDVDKKLGTNKHVFSILGPHTGKLSIPSTIFGKVEMNIFLLIFA